VSSDTREQVPGATAGGVAGGRNAAADRALAALTEELAVCLESLGIALERAQDLRRRRAEGTTWLEVVRAEEPPLVVERITQALDTLNTAGSRWRREEAAALHAEGMSINGIAALFGVTRQRASVLVRDASASDRGRPGSG
jgi:hypothetical protein